MKGISMQYQVRGFDPATGAPIMPPGDLPPAGSSRPSEQFTGPAGWSAWRPSDQPDGSHDEPFDKGQLDVGATPQNIVTDAPGGHATIDHVAEINCPPGPFSRSRMRGAR